MKNIKYLFVMVLALMLSFSCNSDDDSSSDSSALIGTWEMTELGEGYEFTASVIFNANNSGKIIIEETIDGETETETENFTWSTSSNKLTLNYSVSESEVLTYFISGNKLTITDDTGEVSVFIKQSA